MVLTQDQKAAFAHDGYIVVDPGIPPAILDGMVADLSGRYGTAVTENGVNCRDQRRIRDAWRISSQVREAALWPPVLDLLRELYGRTPLPFQTLNFCHGSEQAPHADTFHFNSNPTGWMCGVWIAAEDIDAENGPLIYYPGSHALPEIVYAQLGGGPREKTYRDYENYVQDVIAGSAPVNAGQGGFTPRYGHLRKGQALIWAANLLHGGSPHRDPDRTRHSLVTHYFFEGCRYWTPQRSSDRFTFRRYPVWIRPGPIEQRRLANGVNHVLWRTAKFLGWA
jgi:ectoine hydroxylase-related dioxygenase (phytanoyl-CoA dioxygenase family)